VILNPTRLRALIKSHGFTIKSFGESLGMTREGVYDVLKRKFLKPDLIDEISKVLSVKSIEFIDYPQPENVKENLHEQTLHSGNIIYIPLYAYGGFLGGYRNIVFIDQLEHFRLPGVAGEHYAFEIGGFSMMKPGHELSATPGDVAISRLEEDFKHMLKGKGYILQTIDGLIYKLFDKITPEKAFFASLNEEYDGHSLPLKEIKRVYFVDFILKKTH
jgi:transcriptional regulator with XRE-family HTH domain